MRARMNMVTRQDMMRLPERGDVRAATRSIHGFAVEQNMGERDVATYATGPPEKGGPAYSAQKEGWLRVGRR